jgi:hypothetical protein
MNGFSMSKVIAPLRITFYGMTATNITWTIEIAIPPQVDRGCQLALQYLATRLVQPDG